MRNDVTATTSVPITAPRASLMRYPAQPPITTILTNPVPMFTFLVLLPEPPRNQQANEETKATDAEQHYDAGEPLQHNSTSYDIDARRVFSRL